MKELLEKGRFYFRKYELTFYFGVFGKLCMAGFALYSALAISSSYYGLIALYLTILAIRIPSFFYSRHLDKTEPDLKKRYKKKHWIILGSGIVLLSYIALSPLFHLAAQTTTIEPAKPFFLVFFVLLPWAAIRSGIEVTRFTRFRHNHDPYFRCRSYVNVISVAATIITTLSDLFFYVHSNNLPLAFVIFALICVDFLYWFIASSSLIVIAILGLTGKRKKQLALYEKETEAAIQAYAPFKEEFYSVHGDVLSLSLITLVPATETDLPYYWWSIRENVSKKKVGRISLRLGHNYHSYWNGNVGYEIDPKHQGHHYAATALSMLLPIAKSEGMDKLYLTCDEDNAPSYKTIEQLGGKLLEISFPPKDYVYYREDSPKKRVYVIEL